MVNIRGSQRREAIEETEYILAQRLTNGQVVLVDTDGKRELWVARDDFAGYVVEIDGVGYEFCGTLSERQAG